MTTEEKTPSKLRMKSLAAKGGAGGKGKSKHQMQRRLADAIIEDAGKPAEKRRTKQELLRVAGYLGTAGKQKAEVWNTQGLREALARRGFTQDKMTKVLQEAADAKVVTVYRGDAHETEAPDHAIRLRAVDQLADVMGLKKMTVQQLNVDVEMELGDLKDVLGI